MSYDVYIVHASEDKARCVMPLAEALKGAGLVVWLDDWEIKPGQSLRQRMDDGLGQSHFGVVIVSPHFFQKRWPQAELDALIGKERQGEEVIIPVWLDIEREGVAAKSPILASRRALLWSEGMDKIVESILERVRGKPQLGPAVPQPAVQPQAEPLGPLFLLSGQELGMTVYETRTIEADQETLKAIIPSPDKGIALLRSLQPRTPLRVAFAYDSEAGFAVLRTCREVVTAEGDVWEITLNPEGRDHAGGILEMGHADFSADRLAELRARRILLAETLDSIVPQPQDEVNRMTLEMFVQGFRTPVRVKGSPLPAIYADLRGRPDFFLKVARLYCVYLLRLSGVVETVLQLDLTLREGTRLAVAFEGRRAKKYENAPATVIRVEGVCVLT